MRALNVRRFTSALRLMFVALCALSCTTVVAFGQSQSNAADLQGTVRDAQGAVVANATVTARNRAIGTTREAQSNEDGLYQITNLPPVGFNE